MECLRTSCNSPLPCPCLYTPLQRCSSPLNLQPCRPLPSTRGAVCYAPTVRSCCGGHSGPVRKINNCERGYNNTKKTTGSSKGKTAWSMSRFVVYVGSERTKRPPVAGKKV